VKERIEEFHVKNLTEARKLITSIGCDEKSIDIMAPKALFKVLLIRGVNPMDAIIIKQDMLSVGGEVAIPRDVFWRKEKCEILVMGTLRHLSTLVEKLRRHHTSIREIAKLIEGKLEEWTRS